MNKTKDELIASLNTYVKRLEEATETDRSLIANQREMIQLQREQIHSHRQWSAHERALMMASESRAIEQRAILSYVLERSEKERHWLRLWETLPEDQKEVYKAEAKAWLKANPGRCPDECREVLLDAPKKGLCSETHLDDPLQERWVFCPRCGAYLGTRDLVSGQLVLADKDLKVVQKK